MLISENPQTNDRVSSQLDQLISDLGGKPVPMSEDRVEMRIAHVLSLLPS